MSGPRRKRAAHSAALLHIAEPPVAYVGRPRLVADATVLAAVVFGEAEREQAVALLYGRAIVAPHLVDYEIASVALKKARRERLPSAAVMAALEGYAAIPIERHAVAVGAMFSIAQRYALTAYDAAYLWLAAELETPLATFDDRLAAAAGKHLAGLSSSAPPP